MTKSNKNLVLKSSLFLLVIFIFASCDKEYNTIGSEIIGQDNFGLTKSEIGVNLTNQNLGPVQSSNLPLNALGIYTNAASETTVSNFVTQLELANVNPLIDLDLKPVIDSVILSVPYFSTKTGYKDDNATGIYKLDSIYGGDNAKLKLGVYESGYFLRDINPETQLTQAYFSNQNADFDSAKKALLNNSSVKSENEEFFFSDQEIVESSLNTKSEVVVNRIAPGMKMHLDNTFFQNKFFTAAATGNLSSNNAFKNYFRGLYFKVENSGSAPTNMALLNFKAGKITVYYKQKQSATVETLDSETIVINLTGNSVNLLKNINPQAVDSKNLKIKGGEGSMAIINLFNPEDNNGNGISDELESLRANKLLINDATLTFYIDKAAMDNDTNLPNRLYLYDIDNSKALLDYNYDSSVRTNRKFDKFVHGGILDETTNSYKIKLTYHLRNLIKNDTVTNVRLGLVVSENINDISNKTLKNPINLGSKSMKVVPTSSVISPFEAIIYGNSPEVPTDKKIKLEIYYTKQN